MSAFGGKADIAQTCSDGLLLMLWTAPAPGHRNAVDCLSQAERFKEVRQATTVAFEVEGIGEDRRGNADKVDPGIGTTRVGQRIFECVLLIGTRSAQSIMASGFTAAQTGRTHDRTRPMLQQLRKFLPRRRRPHITQSGRSGDAPPFRNSAPQPELAVSSTSLAESISRWVVPKMPAADPCHRLTIR